MDKKLDTRSFTNIFKDALPATVVKIPEKAFSHCVKNYDLPYLSNEEKECVEQYTNKYLHSIDYTLINFAAKVME